MKKYIFALLFFVFTASNAISQQCVLTAPAAASLWVAGATMPIQWNTGAFSGNVNLALIDYSIGPPSGTVVLNIASNISNTGTYNWLVPNTLPAKCSYGVYIENVIRTNWCYGPSNICISPVPPAAVCCPKFALVTNPIRPCYDNPCKQGYPTPGINTTDGGSAPIMYACKNQQQQYLVVPNLPGFTYNWTVVGGTVVTTPANPATIQWGNTSQGELQVIITNDDGTCRDTIKQIFCLLDGPTAGITFNPNPVCVGSPVNFSGSTSVGATNYYWNFGDGTSSNLENPPPHIYTVSGSYTVVLTVSNSVTEGDSLRKDCGCKATATVVVNVINGKGIDIYTDDCRKMLCPGDTVKYCTHSTNCSSLSWVVNGGTIINGQGTTCISVVWNQPSTYPTTVTLNANCPSACGNSATLFVPVLYPNLPIQGPSPVCPGSNASYSLPALSGTFYNWTISGGGIIAGYNSNHNVIHVTWGNTPGGTYNLTCNYDNPYSGCKGTSTLTVTIKPKFTITGPSQACINGTSSFSASGPANWTITPTTGYTPPGSPAGSFNNVPSITITTWDVANNYTINAVPVPVTAFNYCTPSATTNIVVNPIPVLNSIVGPPGPVCTGQLYDYSVSSNVTGASFAWNFTSGTGTITPYGSGNSNASVIFTGAGPWKLKATLTVNNCSGSTTLEPIIIVPAPTLPTTPITACIGAQINISVATGTGPFNWSTSPAASLLSGQGTGTATYEIHGTGTITVSNCGGTSNAISVTATLPPTISITQIGSLCAGNLQLSVPAGSAYQWSGGSTATTQSINVTIPGTYTVQVTSSDGCVSVASFTVLPVAIPTVSISTGDPLIWCGTNPSVTFQALTLSSGCSYQWYRNGSPVGTNTGTYTATSAGSYYVVVTCGGCVAPPSNTLNVTYTASPCPPGCVPVPPISNPLSAITVTGCNPKTFSVNLTGCTGTVNWNFGDGGNSTGTTVTHTYVNAAVYPVIASITCNGCPFTVHTSAAVPLIPDFNSSVQCGALDGSHIITLNNISQTLGGWNVTSVSWTSSCGTPINFTGNTFVLNTSAGCSPTVTMNIIVTNNVTGQTCIDSKTFSFSFASSQLTITSNIPTPPKVCKDQTYTFTSSMTSGIVQYQWTVNGTLVSQNNPLSYAFDGTSTNPNVGLTVNDAFGCTFTASVFPLTVVTPPVLTINTSKICPDCAPPKTLSTSPTTGFTGYQWYHDGVAISGAINATYILCDPKSGNYLGNYYVTAIDQINNCTVTSNTIQVVYHPKPSANIQGQGVQCVSGNSPYSFTLQNAGWNNPNYKYNWIATGPGTVTFTPDNLQYNPSVAVSQLGTYQFILTVTDINTGCIAKDTFCVYLYKSPTLTVNAQSGMCEGTMYTMTANVTPVNSGYIYQWSNGINTQSITTNQAGNYSVTVTDPVSGCSAYAFAGTIKKSPYVDLFPLGCDTLCSNTKIIPPLPLITPGQTTYNGVYDIKWYVDGSLYYTGPELILAGLSLGQHQIYILVTDIATGCTSKSGNYDLFIIQCCDCKESKWGVITLSKEDSIEVLECNSSYKLICKQPYTINATYNCKDTTCPSKVTYSLLLPGNTIQTGNVAFTFTPSLTGTYALTLYGWCGNKKCDSCLITFKTEECPVDTCCPYEITATSKEPTYKTGDNATIVNTNFTISIPAAINITEVRADVVSYTITDNYNKECMQCVNLPFTWASVSAATNINTATPKITMYGAATTPSFNGSGAGAYQNPREIIWNNGSNLNMPNITNIGMRFLLPSIPTIDCCELTAKICVKFTFRDKDCKECEVITCFTVVIKPSSGDVQKCECSIKPVLSYEGVKAKSVSCGEMVTLFAGSIPVNLAPGFTCKDKNGKDCSGSSVTVTLTKPDKSSQVLNGPNYSYTYKLILPGIYEYTITGNCGGKICECKFKVNIPSK